METKIKNYHFWVDYYGFDLGIAISFAPSDKYVAVALGFWHFSYDWTDKYSWRKR